MKTLLIIMSILAIAAVSNAKEIFKDENVKDLRVVAVQDGKAVIEDKYGVKAEVDIADHIGNKKSKVVEIEKSYITVETEGGRTRVPVVHGFERR